MANQHSEEQPLTRRQLREQEAAAALAQRSGSRVSKLTVRPLRLRRTATGMPVVATRRTGMARVTSVGAMIGIAGMLVATSMPPNVFMSPEQANAARYATAAPEQTQVLDVRTDATLAHGVTRDDVTVVKPPQAARAGLAAPGDFSFTPNPDGTIQWPFDQTTTISSGFGARTACSFCSSQHMGVDFTPPSGTPIRSIADGVVKNVIVERGAYGVHVVVEHEINGQKIESLYAHMLWGSPVVARGQKVVAGQQLGGVGSTGASTGTHLHLEIHIEGTPVDPFAWLKSNAN